MPEQVLGSAAKIVDERSLAQVNELQTEPGERRGIARSISRRDDGSSRAPRQSHLRRLTAGDRVC